MCSKYVRHRLNQGARLPFLNIIYGHSICFLNTYTCIFLCNHLLENNYEYNVLGQYRLINRKLLQLRITM